MAVNLFELLNDLEAKAKAATPDQVDSIIKGALNGSGRQIWHMRGAPAFEEQAKRDVEYYAACSPQTIATLCEALEDARELAEYSREHGERNLTGRNEQYLLAEKARAFLAKYFPKGEHERR